MWIPKRPRAHENDSDFPSETFNERTSVHAKRAIGGENALIASALVLCNLGVTQVTINLLGSGLDAKGIKLPGIQNTAKR
jgi:hypothetical protein